MVVLICGATHTGKTYLAQRLLERYKYPYLSLDHLKMGLIRGGLTELTTEDNAELTPYLWNITRGMVKTAIENLQNLVIEGCYIPFDYKSSFTDEYLCNIKYVCLIFSENYIRKHFDDIKANESVVENRDCDDLSIESLICENQFYLDGCKEYGNEYILIDDRYDFDFTL